MQKAFLSLIIILMATLSMSAQPIGGSAYGTLLKAAQLAVDSNNYKFAIDKYKEAYDDRKDEELLPIIADLRLKIRDYFGASRDYASALRSDKEGELDGLRYNYGRALKMTGKYEQALEELQKFLATNPTGAIKTLAENEISGIELAMAFEEDDKERFKPERLGKEVNNVTGQYSPAYGRDGSLFFTTFEPEEIIIPGETEGSSYAQLYRTKPTEKGWEEPAMLDVKINRPTYHSSSPSFSKDGTRLYFTRARLENNKVTESKIYFASGDGDQWGAANECLGVNGEWIARHPAPGELFGREVLFFVAEIDGGYGGTDIYYATYRGEGVYTEPVNLGPTVNSPGDEVTPHFFDGTLFFSSNGHPGFGGQDIFYTVWDGSRWSAPENVGGRYNTAQDEQYFSLDFDGYKGLFTSNRTGGGARSLEARTCCDDIYALEWERIEASLVVGLFTAGEKKDPITGGTVILTNVTTNKNEQQTQPEVNRFDFPLEVEKSYTLKAMAEGFYPATGEVSTLNMEETEEFVRRLYLEKIPHPTEVVVTDTIVVMDTVTIEKAFVLENILYDFNDDKIKPEAEPDLEILLGLLEENPDLVIELSSHTDYRGGVAYNRNLSQRRANSAKRWLQNKGIGSRRIVAKGYGKALPQTVSRRVAGKFDFLTEGDVLDKPYIDSLETEEEMEDAHQINRRTEFKILEGPTFIAVPRTDYVKRTVIVQPPATPGGKVEVPRGKGPSSQKAMDNKEEGPSGDTGMTIQEGSSLYGQDDISGLPLLVFKERATDFGEVAKGEKREYVYEFTNKGDAEAEIVTITACECTTATSDKDNYKPGESGTINVVFDSTEKDEPETIVIDIFLMNKDKEGYPIVEKIEYSFKIG